MRVGSDLLGDKKLITNIAIIVSDFGCGKQ